MKTIKYLLSILFVPVVLSSAGCPSDGGGSCRDVAACGGNVVGSWKVTESCLNLAGEGIRSFCPRVPLSAEVTIIDGVITYNSDMTYTQTGKGRATVELHVPASCMSSGAGTTTCAGVQALEMDPGRYANLTCRPESGGCVCNGVTVDFPLDETGTWQTAGNVLTGVHDGETESSEYCVSGNEFHQRWNNVEFDGATGNGTIVQVRQ